MRKLEVATVQWMIRQREAEEAAAREEAAEKERVLPGVSKSDLWDGLLTGFSVVCVFWMYGVAVLLGG